MSTQCIWQNRMSTAIHQLNCQIQTIKICKIDTTMIQHGHLDPHESEISTAHVKKTWKDQSLDGFWPALLHSTPWCQSPPKKAYPNWSWPKLTKNTSTLIPPPIALAILSHPGPTSPNFIKVQWKQWRAHRDPPQGPAEIHHFYPFLMGFWWILGPSAGKSLVSMGTYRD